MLSTEMTGVDVVGWSLAQIVAVPTGSGRLARDGLDSTRLNPSLVPPPCRPQSSR
jgi:hypothetical protein